MWPDYPPTGWTFGYTAHVLKTLSSSFSTRSGARNPRLIGFGRFGTKRRESLMKHSLGACVRRCSRVYAVRGTDLGVSLKCFPFFSEGDNVASRVSRVLS